MIERLPLRRGIGERDIFEADFAPYFTSVQADWVCRLDQCRLGVESAEDARQQGTGFTQFHPRFKQLEQRPQQLFLQGDQRHQRADGDTQTLRQHQATDKKGQRRQNIEREHDDGDFPLARRMRAQFKVRHLG